MDPFSQVLAALGARSVRGTGLEAAGHWALAFDGRARLKFVAVTRGRCFLLLPDRPPEMLEEGDVVLIANTRYVVASDPAVEPIEGMPLYENPGQDVVRLGAGDETVMMGGGSGFSGGSAAFVLDALPAFLRIDRTSPAAASVATTLKSLRHEVDSKELGGALVAERLAEILVIEAVRAFVATRPANKVGWITALADPRIGKALTLLHGDVARRWTVPILASEVGMSRSAFAQRFADRVGRPPLDYLTRWRMVLAQRQLSAGESVAAVAAAVGYSSQSAFSHAFKRTFGQTPSAGG
ncbi:AraC-like DNA-binding protein [Rhodopseudomonas julia]|uniref:AraC-like DNA-binding protein n=1 Tax=Rhodopseudomonas julia TaxID=200617 RepID=A0ABU0C945_9BRAD|nr:AraC family transcriptional regulator [Rhodopseudomonas julia]MDQ0326421.1 AraC-like DNA-binding protein [Rhodopseudomonas julia]